MKKIKLLTFILVSSVLFGVSCKKSDIKTFSDDATIYFQNEESVYSFLENPDDYQQGFGYIEVPVLLAGDTSSNNREFTAEIVTGDNENTIVDNMIEIVGGSIDAGKAVGSLRLKVNYKVAMDTEQFTAKIKLLPNDDFKKIDLNFAPYTVRVSNKISKPENWSILATYGFFPKYSDTFYRFILETIELSYFPFKYNSGSSQTGISEEEAERWYLTYYEAAALKAKVKSALFLVNEGKPESEHMKYGDGEFADEIIVI